MGNRTVVILSNDQASTWGNDPQLGAKIAYAMNFATGQMTDRKHFEASLGYGEVIECASTDQATLAVIDSFAMRPLAYGSWRNKSTTDNMEVELLRQAVEKLGYSLVKAPKNTKK